MRLIDVDDLGIGRCSKDVLPAAYCAGWNGLINLLQTAPTVDAAPVVRCRDCKHLYGTLCTVCGLLPRKPDDFCSYGEYQTNGGADHENQRN